MFLKLLMVSASLAVADPAMMHPYAAIGSDTTDKSAVVKSTGVWQIDHTHSELSFSIRHIISRVRGSFSEWKGEIKADPENWQGASVEVEVAAASITTNNEKRDAHLRSGDFFEAEKYPTITFRSTKVEQDGENLTLTGDLTIRGITKSVVLKGRSTGMVTGENGKRRAGFEASATIDRTDFGVSWNRAAEGGGLTLGDEVTINISVAAVEQ